MYVNPLLDFFWLLRLCTHKQTFPESVGWFMLCGTRFWSRMFVRNLIHISGYAFIKKEHIKCSMKALKVFLFFSWKTGEGVKTLSHCSPTVWKSSSTERGMSCHWGKRIVSVRLTFLWELRGFLSSSKWKKRSDHIWIKHCNTGTERSAMAICLALTFGWHGWRVSHRVSMTPKP